MTELRILDSRTIDEKDHPYVKAYEEELIMELFNIYSKNKNRRPAFIEEEMRKMFDRLVVTSQVKSAEASVGQPLESVPNETYMEMKMKKEEDQLKDAVVSQIIQILAG